MKMKDFNFQLIIKCTLNFYTEQWYTNAWNKERWSKTKQTDQYMVKSNTRGRINPWLQPLCFFFFFGKANETFHTHNLYAVVNNAEQHSND